jgi:guanylate kinase
MPRTKTDIGNEIYLEQQRLTRAKKRGPRRNAEDIAAHQKRIENLRKEMEGAPE